ncbi:MAG: insulinase family protein [Bacteroidales bacterium]|nr:insulinase family protein [Bacteroidales bacterium]
MIKFDKFILDNGLKVIVHKDESTPIVAFNVLYNVGARDEKPEKTGFAHLFEHLMFGGSVNIPRFDKPLEKVGGENNAFTNNDITNYYLTLPKQNLETAFWLESDRMLSLAFSPKSLEVQKNVVVEEFKQSYLNQPYGDVWLLLKPLAYKVHPYQWPTIGKNIAHIENAVMKDVKDFYNKFYNPNNAILTIAGNVELKEIKILAKKWFGPIENKNSFVRNLPEEPTQENARELTVERDVPFDSIIKAYHICSRTDKAFYAVDLLSDILSSGQSSRLYKELYKKQQLFSDINAYISGDIDKGLMIIEGKLIKGIPMEKAENAIINELNKICSVLIDDEELQKVKNKVESNLIFAELSILNKAMTLSYFELLGDASQINEETNEYLRVTKEQIIEQAKTVFKPSNCSTLHYLAKNRD